MKTATKETLKFWGVMMSLFFASLYYLHFISAFLHPSKCVLMCINKYGEATLEFLLLLIIIPLTTIGSLLMLWELWHRKQDVEEFKKEEET